MRFEHAIDIDSSPEIVWSVLREVRDWPTWTASMTSVERNTDAPLAIGDKVRIRQPWLPETEWTVTDVVPGYSFTWEATGPGVRTRGHHVIEPVLDGSTVVNSIEQHGPLGVVIGWLTRRLTNRYLLMECEGLKMAVERYTP